jgi:hypothetical protein
MKGNAKDYVSTAQQFFTAYDAHDVDGMLGLYADGALGRYAPYGRESLVPIRGGIDVIWRAFPNAVPNFRVEVIELIPTDGNTVVIQTEMSGPIPAEVPGVACHVHGRLWLGQGLPAPDASIHRRPQRARRQPLSHDLPLESYRPQPYLYAPDGTFTLLTPGTLKRLGTESTANFPSVNPVLVNPSLGS